VPGRTRSRPARQINAERFWSNVAKGPDCWLWTASVTGIGRGQYRVGLKIEQAHRVAWELTYGGPPSGMLRSKCGDLRCVRPDHQVVADRKVGPKSLARPACRRFEAMVRTGPDCWMWTGSTNRLGYGQFCVVSPEHGRRMVGSHRFAWELEYGPIPNGADVLHRCGTRRCVRPDHLLLRPSGQVLPGPTPRQLALLRACLRFGLRYGAVKAAAAEVGVAYATAGNQLMWMRARLGVTTTQAAVQWLDEHQPGWRE
jgi:hypothetical protein